MVPAALYVCPITLHIRRSMNIHRYTFDAFSDVQRYVMIHFVHIFIFTVKCLNCLLLLFCVVRIFCIQTVLVSVSTVYVLDLLLTFNAAELLSGAILKKWGHAPNRGALWGGVWAGVSPPPAY